MTQLLRHSGLAALACAATLIAPAAFAQQPYPAAGTTLSARDQTCRGLETQLANLGGGDAGRAEQIRRTEDTLGRQQAELDRQSQQSRRQGCDATGFFQMFNPAARSEQCTALNNQIQQMRGNIARLQADLQQMQSAGAAYERDGQRRSLIQALAQNNCGPQYQSQAAISRNPLDNLFGGGSEPQNGASAEGVGSGLPPASAYRTVCVRLCDGYFFPISFSTSQSRFPDDEATCQRMCPAAEVALFAYPNPGGDIKQAISTSGQSYTALPNAFKYKTEWSKTCVCKQANESWANAVKDDPATSGAEQSDIIVTEEKARQLSAPRDAKGRPILPPSQKGAQKAGPKGASTAAPAQPAPPPPVADQSEGEKKPIRSVGPKFLSQ